MNTYKITVNNVTITSMGLNEYSAMKNTCIFKAIGEMVDYVRTSEPEARNDAWIYKVELNGQITLAYIKRVA